MEHSREVGQQLLSRELRQLVGRDYDTVRAKDFSSYLRAVGYPDLAALEVAVGRGERNPRQVVKRMFTEEILPTTWGERRRLQLNVKVPAAGRLRMVRAHCCRPIEGDRIVALVVGRETQIHRDECPRVAGQATLAAAWIVDAYRTYRIWLQVQLKTYTGMLRDVADVSAQQRIAIHDVAVRRREGERSIISLLVEIRNTEQLAELMRKLRSLPEVVDVARGRG
ncbi:MAG: ACT domain-containing protein [Candidatus Andersenbacteria bacterium]